MPGWVWPLAAVLFLFIGVLIGYFMGRSGSSAARHARALERELREVRDDQTRYREQVREHFVTTADLINQMTESYREVFRHLATGSEALCGADAPRLTAEVPAERLVAGGEKPEAAQEAPVKTAAEAAAPSSQEAEEKQAPSEEAASARAKAGNGGEPGVAATTSAEAGPEEKPASGEEPLSGHGAAAAEERPSVH